MRQHQTYEYPLRLQALGAYLSEKEYPHIPWHKVKGFRNLIVHDYLGDEIDIKIVNDIVYNKIPELKEAAQEILKRYGEKETAGL
ncbi:MAG: DUF86 domain-containing protein [Alphaproteobacteria bacterium]